MRNRRQLLATLAGLGGLLAATPSRADAGICPRRVQTAIDLVPPDPRSAFALINDHNTTPDWALPGSAATASARAWHGDQGLGQIVAATWRLVWNPDGNPWHGAQLSHVARGYLDECVIASFANYTQVTPIHVEQDVTAPIQALQARQAERFFVHKLRGQPIVFASTLELVWELGSAS